MAANTAWPGGGAQGATAEQPFGNLDGIGEQDFANLLDFESFDFLTTFEHDAHKNQNGGGIDLNMLANAAANSAHQQHHEGQQRQQQQQHLQQQQHQHEQQHTPQTPTQQQLFEMQMGNMGFGTAPPPQQHTQAFAMPNHGMPTHQMVPPTPNSVEMHNGDMGRFLQQLDAQTRAILEHEYKKRQQESMNFTPLGTPAVTPHEAQFNPGAGFAVPGEYFSPLVSPALEGQQRQNQHTSGSAASTASPVDFDMDLLGDATTSQSQRSRRTRRQSTSTRSGGRSSKVAQSPIQKPAQKRKTGLSSTIPPKEVSELLEMHSQAPMSPTSPNIARVTRNYPSSSDSISPEPLSEGLMRPPPKPHSARQSPMILASSKSPMIGPNGVGTMPATPASLMRIAKDSPLGIAVPSTIHEQHGDDLTMLDDLLLPEAASIDPRTNLPKIDTAAANGEATPRMSARRGPKSAPLINNQVPTTTKPSPLVSAMTSPISAVASPITGRRDSTKHSGRGAAKKRGSVSSQLVSPALLPRISPSIKPLLPSSGSGGTDGSDKLLTEEQHALLLTSRSNYQNLIEGRNIPGVTYPSDLPSQLTSKRTSHKIAEQGRRQRINVALQEMQGLLPKLTPQQAAAAKLDQGDDDDDEEDEGVAPGANGAGSKRKGGKGGGNSKAATVEHAIVYIRQMQKEKEEREREMESLRKKVEEMERRWESVSKSPAEGRESGSEGDVVVVKSSDCPAEEDAVMVDGEGEGEREGGG